MAVIKIKTIKSNLQAVINYGKNGNKTDNGILVSSVNCSVDTAYEEMVLTKKFFHKEDKTLGYHIIQSFKGNEVSPERANQIGKELAEELWGDKYQVVICTHINKENVHNHLILNSVSLIDGKKYHNVKEEIPVANPNKKYYRKVYTGPKINRFLLQTSSFYRLYVHYLYLFGILPAKNEYKEISPEYYKQKRKNNMIFEEINFLGRNNFNSVKEVEKYMDKLENQLPELKGKRELLWKKHKSADKNEKVDILKEINTLTNKIDTIQAQKKACNRIIARYEEIKEDYKKELESKEKSQGLIIADKKKRARNR